MADPDLELREVPGLDFLALLAFFPLVISSFFFNPDKGWGGGGGGGGEGICILVCNLPVPIP